MRPSEVDNWTLKRAAEYALKRMVLQGVPCKIGNDCMYGNEEGKHCGVGFLLNPKNPKLMEFEGNVTDLADTYPKAIPNLVRRNLDFFITFQEFHDYDSFIGRKKALNQLKKEFPKIVDLRNPHWKQWMNLGVQYECQ